MKGDVIALLPDATLWLHILPASLIIYWQAEMPGTYARISVRADNNAPF